MANEHNLIPAKPGEVRNPNGRPKGVPNSKTRLARLLTLVQNIQNPITGEQEGFTVAEQMDMQQILKALGGDTKAYQAVTDRLEGRPAQAVDVTSGGENINKLKAMTDDELRTALNESLKRRPAD